MYHGDGELEQEDQVLTEGVVTGSEIQFGKPAEFELDFRVRHEKVHEMGGNSYQSGGVRREEGVRI